MYIHIYNPTETLDQFMAYSCSLFIITDLIYVPEYQLSNVYLLLIL